MNLASSKIYLIREAIASDDGRGDKSLNVSLPCAIAQHLAITRTLMSLAILAVSKRLFEK
ncbi:hypothetical protein LC653_35075 [Nostoc sp. CHAB 5784]|uniref:hypothetical protein n=1 Tax=Nostoc mirabile TaxID=2907820 RepID=UPI001E5855B8|nr:hypothetical protein [Nostoc mirabile]MCC5668942.1 hypothetical protein [Nostoc mirabile CHAB5784]